MNRIISLLFFSFIIVPQLHARIFPEENSTLNYRLIGFCFPAPHHVNNYSIEIALGNYNTADSFKKHIILSRYADTNRLIAEVPFFGKDYTWRIVFTTRNSTKIYNSRLYHFSTGYIPAVDTNLNRLRILTSAQKYKDAFVFVDALGVLYDMNGLPVWYLPPNKENSNNNLRDLKLSPLGTITYLMDRGIFEINYNGKILWKTPDTSIMYHHEFSRLSNGHYMVLGLEFLLCHSPSLQDSSSFSVVDEKAKRDSTKIYKKIAFGTLIEYDEKGNVVWLWRTVDYVMHSDLLYSYYSGGYTDQHDNSFFFDEQNKEAYISFKGLCRVIRVKYPDGNVLNTYGKIFTKDNPVMYHKGYMENRNDFFCGQHACRRSQKGYLYLFDNGCDPDVPSKIVIMRQPLSDKDSLQIIWEYTFQDKAMHMIGGGGNVTELPDQSIFASMGPQNSKLFIVNPDKEIVWNAISETWNKNEKKWEMTSSYRASIISNYKDLEQLIWNSEK